MSEFVPNVIGPRPRVTRRTSLSGKPYKGGHAVTALDPLEEWEGARTFRDPRSPSGWVDAKNHVIGGVTQNGVPLLLRRDGKLSFNPHVSSGGFLGGALSVFVPSLAALEFQQEVTRGVFGSEVAAFTDALAANVANTVLPGAGQVIGITQDVQAIVAGDGAPDLLPNAFRAPAFIPDAADRPRSSVPPLAVAAGLLILLLVVSK